MKRTYKYALTVVLGLGMVAPAFGQDGFPDVKDTHWAADSVNRLKLTGLIHGDSDGKFNGDRTMTRYEVATILYAVYNKLVGFNAETEKNLKALEAKINSMQPNTAPAVDLSDIKSAVADLQREVGTMKTWGSDLAQLKKMWSSYASELKSLGLDVDGMKKQISDLQARVSKLEKGPGGISISGDFNTWMASATPANGSGVVLNQDGQFLNTTSGAAGFNPLLMLHELGVTVQDQTASVPYKAEIVIGNTVTDRRGSGGFGTQTFSNFNLGNPILDASDSVYIHEATAKYKPWDIVVGRQGVQVSPFTLQRPDSTSFYKNQRWDDHTYRMDGFNLGFAGGKGHVFMGVTSNTINSAGADIQPLVVNNFPVNRLGGATFDIPVGGEKGKIRLSYLDLDGSAGATFFGVQPLGEGPPQTDGLSRINVYGIDLNFDLGGITLSGGAGKSVQYGTQVQETVATPMLDTLVDTANGRWNVSLGNHDEHMAWKVGYRAVETNYLAPGDWGRVSIFRNLNDTRSFNAYGMLKLSEKLHVHGWYEKGDGIQGPGDYTTWKAGFGYALTSKWNVDAMYDNARFNGGFQGLTNGAESKFTTVNLGYDLGDKTMLNLFVQNTDIKNILTSSNKGYFYGMQFSVKF